MNRILFVAVVGAMTTVAMGGLAQTAKPPAKPASAAKPAAVAPASKPVKQYAGFRPAARHAVFVPPPPVIELDEISPPADLPTVLGNEDRDRYRRIFQEQASGH